MQNSYFYTPKNAYCDDIGLKTNISNDFDRSVPKYHSKDKLFNLFFSSSAFDLLIESVIVQVLSNSCEIICGSIVFTTFMTPFIMTYGKVNVIFSLMYFSSITQCDNASAAAVLYATINPPWPRFPPP